ncbi:MAG: biotin/lipoyl-binding protein [Ruminococcaceae bacterium]|nr:biotin/lipoyl-binding protein [Oscillospiraceae bacterium]
MKKYNVTVNGTAYEITLEVVDAADVKAAPVATAATVAPVVEAKAAPAAPVANGATVNAPMPGTILSVNVQNGATVKKGDVLMVLEAMKMENEIMSPVDGTVASINVQNGASVDTGAVLCVIA